MVRAPNWLGDVVLSLPALRDLRRNFPQARIEVLARARWPPLYARRRARSTARAAEHRRRAPMPPSLRGALRRGGAAAELVRLRVHRVRTPAFRERWGYATDGRALLLTRAGAACAPRSGAAARCTTIGRCSRRRTRASQPRPTRRLRCPTEWRARRRRQAAGDERALDRPQPRRLLRHRQALAPRALRRGRGPLRANASARASRSSAPPPSGRSARRCASAHAPAGRACCAARPPCRSWRACSSQLAPPRHQRLRAHARGGGARHAGGRRLRPDRLARDGARRARPQRVVREPVALLAVHAARVPDRPPLHDARRRRTRVLGGRAGRVS